MASLKQAVTIIKVGGVAAYSTESFWALGADATNPRAIRRVFSLKRRERKPIALIAGNWKQVEKFFTMTKRERSIAQRHWPGALTVLLKPKKKIAARALFGTVPSGHSAGDPSLVKEGMLSSPRRSLLIGVRVPAHAQARKLALLTGAPITATSANVSGEKPTKSISAVRRTFFGILALSGRCGRIQKPSTVVELSGEAIRVVRTGSVKI